MNAAIQALSNWYVSDDRVIDSGPEIYMHVHIHVQCTCTVYTYSIILCIVHLLGLGLYYCIII